MSPDKPPVAAPHPVGISEGRPVGVLETTPVGISEPSCVGVTEKVLPVEAQPTSPLPPATAPGSATPGPPSPDGLEPWRESDLRSRWFAASQTTEAMHPFVLLGWPDTFEVYRERFAACSTYLTSLTRRTGNEAAIADLILKAPAFQACRHLDPQGFEVRKSGARRPRRDPILPSLFAEPIEDADHLVRYMTSSQARWEEALQRQNLLAVLAANLAGPEGQRIALAGAAATARVADFVATHGLRPSAARDGRLWLQALCGSLPAGGSNRPILRVPVPWEGPVVETVEALLRAVDADPGRLVHAIRNEHLAFWLDQAGGGRWRGLVRTLLEASDDRVAAARVALWTLGERRLTWAREGGGTVVTGDAADLLRLLEDPVEAGEGTTVDRLVEDGTLATWARLTDQADLARAVKGAFLVRRQPQLRLATLRWGLGARDLVPGVTDVDGLVDLALRDPTTACALATDGRLVAWVAATGRELTAAKPPDQPPLAALHGWLRALGRPVVLAGGRVWRAPEDLLAALALADGEAAALVPFLQDLVRDGVLAPWLGVPDPSGGSTPPDLFAVLRVAGFQFFWDSTCGWVRTPLELAAWADAARDRTDPFLLLLKGRAGDWLQVCHPTIWAPLPACLVGRAPAEMAKRYLGLPAPEVELRAAAGLDLGRIREGTERSVAFELVHRGPRGVAPLQVRVTGLDSGQVSVSPDDLALKPGETHAVQVTVRVPPGGCFLSGRGVVEVSALGAAEPVGKVPVTFRGAMAPWRKATWSGIGGIVLLGAAVGAAVWGVSAWEEARRLDTVTAGLAEVDAALAAGEWASALERLDALGTPVPAGLLEAAGTRCRAAWGGLRDAHVAASDPIRALHANLEGVRRCALDDRTVALASPIAEQLLAGRPLSGTFDAEEKAAAYRALIPVLRTQGDAGRQLARDYLSKVGFRVPIGQVAIQEFPGTLSAEVTRVTLEEATWEPPDQLRVQATFQTEGDFTAEIPCENALVLGSRTLRSTHVGRARELPQGELSCSTRGERFQARTPRTYQWSYTVPSDAVGDLPDQTLGLHPAGHFSVVSGRLAAQQAVFAVDDSVPPPWPARPEKKAARRKPR